MTISRGIRRNIKRNLDIVPSPHTRGTTLNKKANDIAERIRGRQITFKEAYNEVMTPRVIATHNLGEFRHYPPKGTGCLRELIRLAVSKKLGKAVLA